MGKVATHQCCHGGTWYTMLEPEEMERSLGKKPKQLIGDWEKAGIYDHMTSLDRIEGVDMEKDLVVCEVPFGGAVIFSNVLPHRR